MSRIVMDTNEREKRQAVHKKIEKMRVEGIISRDEADRRKFLNDGFETFLEVVNVTRKKIRL